MNTDYSWYVQRVRSMSLPEIFFRIRQQAGYKTSKKYTGYFPSISNVATSRCLPPISISLLRVPDSYYFSVFHTPVDFKDIRNWHADPVSNGQFPKKHSFEINIRNDHYGNAKIVWEYNRLQFLTFICCRYRQTGDPAWLRQLSNIINSWIDDNPYLVGINWYSNIEVNLRLITWFLCWEILDVPSVCKANKEFEEFVQDRWLPCIYLHCSYSYSFPSKHSSANNHLIAEYAGLFVASSLWKFEESQKWNDYAKKGLEEEIVKQHSESGINREEAAEYIQFITDFFLLAYVTGQNSNNRFSEQYAEKLKQVFYYIYNFLDCNGNFPQYGDEDDGKCFILDFEPRVNNFQSLLAAGATLFRDPVLKAKAKDFDTKNCILFGEEGQRIFSSLREVAPARRSVFYPDEGHFICRHYVEGKEIYLHVDAAPLGFLSIAAHGHADALSFILHLNGQPVLVDPGTFTYHTRPEWRNYFMGTLAHNTIRLNEQDQAISGGPTLWLNHYKTKVLSAESDEARDKIVAQHNGYKNAGVIHTRTIDFDKTALEIQITDHLEKSKPGTITIEIPFHIHPAVAIKKINDSDFELTVAGNMTAVLQTDKSVAASIVKGQTEPQILGWYSSSFLKKEPSPTIYSKLRSDKSITLTTSIKLCVN